VLLDLDLNHNLDPFPNLSSCTAYRRTGYQRTGAPRFSLPSVVLGRRRAFSLYFNFHLFPSGAKP
jgi:hypothetical protein